MKSCFYAAILALIFINAGFSQTNKTSDCATISVTGPTGIPQPGEPVIFTAAIKKANSKNIEYYWTVSGGKILSGQGTSSISVETSNEWWSRSNTTATIEVKGLPQGCTNQASETFGISDGGEYRLVEGFENITIAEEKERLKKINITPIKKSTYNIQFFIQGTNRREYIAAKRRELIIKKFLIEELKIPADRIFFAYAESDADLTKVYIVAIGAELPNEK